MTGAKIDLIYERGYPVMVNHAAQTDSLPRVAAKSPATPTSTTRRADDGRGGFRLHAGSAAGRVHLLGNGDSAGLHHPAYNFNDEAIVYGTSYWIKLVENTLAA